jgi:hypothetical protein
MDTVFTAAGLFLDILGVIVLTSGLIISENAALELGVPKYASESREENLKRYPAVRDRLAQSNRAKIGVVLLVGGFIGQLIGALI